MSVELKPGDLLIDMSGFRLDSPAKVAQAKKAGIKGVLRYSAGAASSPSHPSHSLVAWKLITPAEYKQLIADGFDVIPNSEWTEDRITEGAAAGHADGAADMALWRECGLPKGASIYVSMDHPLEKLAGVEAYLEAYQTALNGYYFADNYGGTPLLRALLQKHCIRYGWRPNAGSWSDDGLPYQPNTSTAKRRLALVTSALDKTPAHIWQTGNYAFGKNADEDMVLRTPVGSHWDAVRANEPKPKPKPPKPTLHRKWPGSMPADAFFGPADVKHAVHNGHAPAIGAIQHRLHTLGFLPLADATGEWNPATTAAVEKWHAKHFKKALRPRCITKTAWIRLFTY